MKWLNTLPFHGSIHGSESRTGHQNEITNYGSFFCCYKVKNIVQFKCILTYDEVGDLMRVGIFDSGIGGINVLSCLRKKYPNNDYIYFGDTINLPYGDKTKAELMKLAHEAIDFLLTKNVELIIIACGTISSNCYNELKLSFICFRLQNYSKIL